MFRAALPILLFLLAFSHACASKPPLPPPEGPQLKVATFNVNFGLQGDVATAQALMERPLDIICFQETNRGWARTLVAMYGDELPHHRFLHRPAAGGMGIMSRYPLQSVQALPGVGWFPAMLAVVKTPLGPVQVLNVHLRPPVSDDGSFVSGDFSTGEIRRGEVEAFSAHLSPDLPTLVMGDFNEEANGDAVEWLGEQREMRDTLEALDAVEDTWRWTTRWGVTLNSALDHILFDDRLVPVAGDVLKAGRSDHLPVVATFARPKAGWAPPAEPSSLSP